MTDIEQKALALAIEAREDDKMRLCPDPTLIFGNWEALCRAIEQHEAFKKEVSDTLQEYIECFSPPSWHRIDQFIIPKPKPDTLVDVCNAVGLGHTDTGDMADEFRAALDAAGFEIREKGQ